MNKGTVAPSPERPFAGRVALVTGGGRGIGAAISRALARRGAYVYINYRSRTAAAAETLEVLRADGGDGAIIQASVADAAQAASMFAQIAETSHRLDFLVNNAGLLRDRLLGTMSEEDWRCVMATNLDGLFRCSRLAVRLMIAQRFGRIVNIGSVHGVTGSAGQTSYASTKAAMIGFTRSLAQEVGRQNIRVNCVLPGVIETEMLHQLAPERRRILIAQTALKRAGRADEVADVVAFLLSERAAYVHGASLFVDGGFAHA